MKEATTYLMFDGNCKQAMEFYKTCLKAELELMPFSDMPADASPKPITPDMKDRVMHARLSKGALSLMASDTMPGTPFTKGNNFSISLNCESNAEVDALVDALATGGKVTMKPAETFWGAYFGMIEDQFGIGWMFNYDHPQKQ